MVEEHFHTLLTEERRRQGGGEKRGRVRWRRGERMEEGGNDDICGELQNTQRKRQTELEERRGRTNGGLSEGHRER